MDSLAQQLRRIVRRQLLLMWVTVGGAWAYAFTLVGDASWNLGWTLLLWGLFSTGFAVVGIKTLNQTVAHHAEIYNRISTLETRLDELESDSID